MRRSRSLLLTLVLAALTVVGAGHTVGAAGAESKPDEFAALDRLAAATSQVGFKIDRADVAKLLEVIQKGTGLEIEIQSKSLQDRYVSFDTGKVTLKEALVQLAKSGGLTYEVVGPNKLIVRDKASANAG
jgi:hypothetical protein